MRSFAPPSLKPSSIPAPSLLMTVTLKPARLGLLVSAVTATLKETVKPVVRLSVGKEAGLIRLNVDCAESGS